MGMAHGVIVSNRTSRPACIYSRVVASLGPWVGGPIIPLGGKHSMSDCFTFDLGQPEADLCSC